MFLLILILFLFLISCFAGENPVKIPRTHAKGERHAGLSPPLVPYHLRRPPIFERWPTFDFCFVRPCTLLARRLRQL